MWYIKLYQSQKSSNFLLTLHVNLFLQLKNAKTVQGNGSPTYFRASTFNVKTTFSRHILVDGYRVMMCPIFVQNFKFKLGKMHRLEFFWGVLPVETKNSYMAALHTKLISTHSLTPPTYPV